MVGEKKLARPGKPMPRLPGAQGAVRPRGPHLSRPRTGIESACGPPATSTSPTPAHSPGLRHPFSTLSLPHAHRRDGGRDHGRGDHAPGRPENAAHDPGRVRPVQGHRRLHDQDRARGGRRHPVQGAWREETEREREKDRGCTLQGTRTLSRSPPPILTPQGWEPRVLWIGLGGCVFFSALEQAKRAYAPKPEDWPPPAAAASRGKK